MTLIMVSTEWYIELPSHYAVNLKLIITLYVNYTSIIINKSSKQASKQLRYYIWECFKSLKWKLLKARILSVLFTAITSTQRTDGRKEEEREREDRQANGSHWAPYCANTKQEVPRVDKAHPGGQPPQGNKAAAHHKCVPTSQALPQCQRTSSNYPRGQARGPASTGPGTCDILVQCSKRGWLWEMKPLPFALPPPERLGPDKDPKARPSIHILY